MKESVKAPSSLGYARKLIAASASGLQSGRRAGVEGQSASKILASSARDSLLLALAGACAGLLPSCFLRGRRRIGKALAFGALGGVAGFCTGVSWKTRKLASNMSHSALREVGKVRDEHWLEDNPITYA